VKWFFAIVSSELILCGALSTVRAAELYAVHLTLACRTHFNYTVPEHREMSFKRGDIFLITDTLFGGVVGSWQASRIVRTPPHELKKGVIPNLSR
jgi:hypothetical protein